MKFEKNIRAPQIYFSPVTKDFLIRDPNITEIIYTDSPGHKYNRDDFENLMPLLNYRQLVVDNKFPDSLNGEKLEIDKIRLNNIMMRIYPGEIDATLIQLNPMLESKSGKIRLEMPDDFFRITKRMEFINCNSNKIEEDKSQLFTTALLEKQFAFPAKLIGGNPTTKKAFDEGYFVLDSKNQLFHIKMQKGKPFCVNTNIPSNLDVAYLKIMEMPLREFYGFLLTTSGEAFLISYDRYKLIKLPLEGFNIKEKTFAFFGDQFFRTISLIGKCNVRTVVTDRNYNIVKVYENKWEGNKELSAGVLAAYLFPFTLSFTDLNSSLSNFYFETSGIHGIILSVLLSVITVLLLKKRSIKLSDAWFDLVLVLVTGIFGFIAVSFVKNVENNLE